MVKISDLLKSVKGLMVAIMLSGSLFAQDKAQAYSPIDMSPFSDSRNHWYGISDKGNIVNPEVNQPTYPQSEITKIADNMLFISAKQRWMAKKLRHAGYFDQRASG